MNQEQENQPMEANVGTGSVQQPAQQPVYQPYQESQTEKVLRQGTMALSFVGMLMSFASMLKNLLNKK
jgi:hypothetical protein